MDKSSYVVKSIQTPPKDILGNDVENIVVGVTIFKRIILKNKFLKIYSDGTGTYQNIK